MADKFYKKSFKILGTRQSGVLEIADYDIEFRFFKFKMADPIWRTDFEKSFNFSETRYLGVLKVVDYETLFIDLWKNVFRILCRFLLRRILQNN